MKNNELLKGSTSMLVLKLLENEPKYGYSIVRELERKSMGVFQLREASLYPILHTLEADGLVTSSWHDAENNRRRKYYSITNKGQDELKRRKDEWTEFFTAVNTVLEGGGELAYI